MLQIRIRDKDDFNIYTKVNQEFLFKPIPDTKAVRQLIKNIDKGEYCNSNSFIDRFGDKTDMSYLSAGCKTGLLLEYYRVNNIDKEIDTVSCGYNAIEDIIAYCTDGKVIVQDFESLIRYPDEHKIDVCLHEKEFKTIGEFNKYIDSYEYYKRINHID